MIAAIANLRRIAATLEQLEGAENEALASWFRACLLQYEAGARHGQDLEMAFGLARAPGEPPWWLVEARDRRDALILQAAAGRTGSMRSVARDLMRDRAFMYQLVGTGAPISYGTIRAVLAKTAPLPPGHAGMDDIE